MFSYAVLPPANLPRDGTSGTQEDLKEWGSPVEESEVYRIEDLEEFVSSNFSSLFQVKEANPEHSQLLHRARVKRDAEAAILDEGVRSLKRLRSDKVGIEIPRLTSSDGKVAPVVTEPQVVEDKDLDLEPLYHVIPQVQSHGIICIEHMTDIEFFFQPHVHPSLLPKKPPKESVKGYDKTIPIPISPHVQISPPSRYDRSAWLIPVRGKLPWEGCTSAAVLAPLRRVPIEPGPITNGHRILWSHDALQRFWKFILSLRDNGSLGAIGISFHATPPSRVPTGFSYSYSTPSCVGAQIVPRDTLPSIASSESGHSTPSASILFDVPSSVDYMKIYHEGPRRMIVRTALDVWRYDVDAKDGSQKVRPLKGAKLVLLDHRSRGVLIS